MNYGPNTSDTRANPPLAMLVADIASWSQHFFRQNLDRASSFRHCQIKKLVKERQSHGTLVLCTYPWLTTVMLTLAKMYPLKPYSN